MPIDPSAIGKTGDAITVAVHDPFAPFPLDDIRRVTGVDVVRVVAPRSHVERVNRTFYDLQTSLVSPPIPTRWLLDCSC